eukprot:4453525-Pleurochrysis_carterae.AAC.1
MQQRNGVQVEARRVEEERQHAAAAAAAAAAEQAQQAEQRRRQKLERQAQLQGKRAARGSNITYHLHPKSKKTVDTYFDDQSLCVALT